VASLKEMGMTYDVGQALRDGHDYPTIAEELSRATNYNLDAARDAGVDNETAVHAMITGEADFSGPKTAGGAVVQGVVRGAADTVAAVAGGATMLATAPEFILTQTGLLGDRPSLARQVFEGFASIPEQLGEITYSDISDVHPSVRPYAFGGEVLGGSVVPTGVFMGLAKAGVKTAGQTMFTRYINDALEFAKTAPGSFATAEMMSAFSSAGAAGLAETFAPNDEITRLGAELVGAALNPSGFVMGKVTPSAASIKNAVVSSFSEAKQKELAANFIATVVEEHKGDMVAIRAAVKLGDSMGLPLAPGFATGDESLNAITRAVILDSKKHGREIAAGVAESFTILESAARTLSNGDMTDPKVLQALAQTRDIQFNQLVDGRLGQVQAKVDEIFGRLVNTSPRELGEASKQAVALHTDAVKGLRKVEKDLWTNGITDTDVFPTNSAAAIASLREGLVDGEPFPGGYNAFIRILQGPEDTLDAETVDLLQSVFANFDNTAEVAENTVSAKKILRWRSLLMNRASALSAGTANTPPDYDGARMLRTLANGALKDVADVPGVETARAFSVRFNDNYTRGFVAKALRQTGRREAAIAPEEVLFEAFGGNVTDTRVGIRRHRNIEQLESAAEMAEEYLDKSFLSPLRDAENLMLNHIFRTAINPENGLVDSVQLGRIAAANADTLELFPGLKSIAQDGAKALDEFQKVTALNATDTAYMRSSQAINSLIGDQTDVRRAIDTALKGKSPVDELGALSDLATSGGEGTVNGLRAAYGDYVLAAAARGQGKNGMFYWKLDNILDEKVGNSGRTSLEFLTDKGIFSPDQADSLRQIATRGRALERDVLSGDAVDIDLDGPDGFFNAILRIIGANLGGALSITGNASLIAASTGSKVLRNLFEKLPRSRTKDFVYKAMTDRAFFLELTEKAPTSPAALRTWSQLKGRRLNAALLQAALVPGRDEGHTAVEFPRTGQRVTEEDLLRQRRGQ